MLLAEIDRITIASRCTRSRAVDALREALQKGQAAPSLVAAAAAASERHRIPSRSILFGWLRAREVSGLLGLVPKPKRVPAAPDSQQASVRMAERLSRERVRTAARILSALSPDELDRALGLASRQGGR